jgi:hypothetical protein
MIFWHVTPYNLLDTYKWFSDLVACMVRFYPKNRDNNLLQNTGICSPQHTVSHPTIVILLSIAVRFQNLITLFYILHNIMNIWWNLMKLINMYLSCSQLVWPYVCKCNVLYRLTDITWKIMWLMVWGYNTYLIQRTVSSIHGQISTGNRS